MRLDSFPNMKRFETTSAILSTTGKTPAVVSSLAILLALISITPGAPRI
jgi:hypothetical protein